MKNIDLKISQLMQVFAYLRCLYLVLYLICCMCVHVISVLDCPTIEYLDNLLSLQQLEGSDFQMIAHMSPLTVVQDPRYQTFIDRY